MQHGMFTAADVEIHRHPITLLLGIDELSLILRIDKSQIVPAGAGPLRHRVGFTACRRPTNRISSSQPVGEIRQWAFAAPGWFEVIGFGQQDRQLLFRKRKGLVIDPYNRKGFAPVPLTGRKSSKFSITGISPQSYWII